MAKDYIVFDIETAPLLWDSLSYSQQEYITRGAHTEEEIEKKKFEMGLSPMTAQVACIGVKHCRVLDDGSSENIKTVSLGTVRNYTEDDKRDETLVNDDKLIVRSEAEILEMFWKSLEKHQYASLVSFNGRNFDAPFLMLRSALNKVRPSRNLMAGTKFNYPLHVDLIDELTFYSPSSYGATRRFNFDYYTRAFGITSPKAEGVDGSMVGVMFDEGKIREISEYCLRDVNATWELFLYWSKYLNFQGK